MLHVFVETNWLVDCAAPAHNKVPAALDLLHRAREGELQLHLPVICLTEARGPLHRKFQPRLYADRVRRFLAWAEEQGTVTPEHAATVRTCLDQLENAVNNDVRSLDRDLRELAASPGLEAFPMNEQMLSQQTDLSLEAMDLKPYDQAILACVIVRDQELLQAGEIELVFCELDSDLQPWDRNGDRKDKLADLYDRANVWVYGDYLLESPPMRPDWHHRAR